MFYRTFVAPELKAAHGNVHQRGAGVENLDIRSDNLPPAMLATFPTVRYPTRAAATEVFSRAGILVDRVGLATSAYVHRFTAGYGRFCKAALN